MTIARNDSDYKRSEIEAVCIFCDSGRDVKLIAKRPICAECVKEIDNVEWESLPAPESGD